MLVSGVPIGNDYDRLERYVCAASPLEGRPAACYELPENMRHQG